MSTTLLILCVLAAPFLAICAVVFCVGLLALWSLQHQHLDVNFAPQHDRGVLPSQSKSQQSSKAASLSTVSSGLAGYFTGRLRAQFEGDFVVVLIGSAFSDWHGIPQAVCNALSMRQMLTELKVNMLCCSSRCGMLTGADSYFIAILMILFGKLHFMPI